MCFFAISLICATSHSSIFRLKISKIFFRWEIQKFLNWKGNTFWKLLGVQGPTEVATVKIRNFRCEDGTIFRVFTILALKKLFLLVAPSGGLKHPNMQTRKVSKFDLEAFKLFTKKIYLIFSVANWAKQWGHKRNYALWHENDDVGSKIGDFEQKWVPVVFLGLAFGFTAEIHSEIACTMPFQRSNILKIPDFHRKSWFLLDN